MKDNSKQTSPDTTKSRQGLNKPKPMTKKEKFQSKLTQYHWENPGGPPFEPQISSIRIGDNVIGEKEDKRDISLNYLRVPLLIFQDSKRNLTDILLYCRIYDLARNDKEKDSTKRRCWGDDEYLALPLNLSFSTMQRSLARLMKSGLVKKVQDFEEKEGGLPDIPRLLAPQKNFFKKSDGQNAQYIRLYYGLFYDERLSREIILLYSYIYSQSNAPWNVAQYDGYYTFSFSQESKKFNYSYKTLSKYLKQMNELGLIELHVYKENSPIIKPRFDLDKYFNFSNDKSNSKSESELKAPKADSALEEDLDDELEDEDAGAQEAQEETESTETELDTNSYDNSPIVTIDNISNTIDDTSIDFNPISIFDSTSDSISSLSPDPDSSSLDTFISNNTTTNSTNLTTLDSSLDTSIPTPSPSTSTPSYVTIDDDFEF